MKCVAHILLAAASIAAIPCIHAQSATFSDRDQSFLKDSAQGHMAELKLAQLALHTSKDATVTTFAKKMIDDHQKLLDETKPVATRAGMRTPDGLGGEGDAEYLKLRALNGENFDKSYIRIMVNKNHKDLESARAEHEATRNEDMRRLAAQAQELIAGQVEMVDRIAAKMGV